MSHLRERMRVAGISGRALARSLDLHHADVFHYLAGRRHKVGRAKRRLIRQYLISIGLLSAPKPRLRHSCPHCGKVHTYPNPFRARRSAQPGE